LRAALKNDPQMAAAAFNLGVLVSSRNLDDAIRWCQQAYDLRSDEPKYACTLAFFLRQKGNSVRSIELLREVIRRTPSCFDAYMLLGAIYEEHRDFKKAASAYRDVLQRDSLSSVQRQQAEMKLRSAESEQEK